MAINFQKPDNNESPSSVLSSIVDNVSALSKMDPAGSPIIPDGFVRMNNGWFEEYNQSKNTWNKIPGNFNNVSIDYPGYSGNDVFNREYNDNVFIKLIHEYVFEDTPGMWIYLPGVSYDDKYKIVIQARWGTGPNQNLGRVGLFFSNNSSTIFNSSNTNHFDCFMYHGRINGTLVDESGFKIDCNRSIASNSIRLSDNYFPFFSEIEVSFIDPTIAIVSGQGFAIKDDNMSQNSLNYIVGGHTNFSDPITIMGVQCWPYANVTGLRGFVKIFKYPKWIIGS